MDFIIVNMTLNSSEKEKNKTKAIEMKPVILTQRKYVVILVINVVNICHGGVFVILTKLKNNIYITYKWSI